MARYVPTHQGTYYAGYVVPEPLRPTVGMVGLYQWKAIIHRSQGDALVVIDEQLFDNHLQDDAVKWMKSRVQELDDAMGRRVAPHEEADDG